MTFNLTRGETLSLAFEGFDPAGLPTPTDALTGATCRANLKLARNGDAPGDAAEVEASFTVTAATEVVPGGGPGFVLTLSAEQTEALAPGNYVTDAKVTFPSGYTRVANLQRVTVLERVTQ